MKQLITQYGGLKREVYILFIGRLVTAMGSFVWPIANLFEPTWSTGYAFGYQTDCCGSGFGNRRYHAVVNAFFFFSKLF